MSLAVRALEGIPEVREGDDLGALIRAALGERDAPAGSVITIAHTIVSKAEGALVRLADVEPGERALELARDNDRDPRLLEVVLRESSEILRAERGVIISRTRHGLICANAGVDASNAGAQDTAILLPRDPDSSARRIRARLRELAAAAGDPVPTPAPAVLITDTFGRAWRLGQTDVAIGLAGLRAYEDWRGRADADGLTLRATMPAIADAAAGAADLARSKDSREPVVVIEGLQRFVTDADGPGASALLRPAAEDLFL